MHVGAIFMHKGLRGGMIRISQPVTVPRWLRQRAHLHVVPALAVILVHGHLPPPVEAGLVQQLHLQHTRTAVHQACEWSV